MPGHRSPDGTVMVRGGQPTHGEDDSKIAKVSKILFWYFFLNVTSGYLLMKPSTYLLSDYNCLRLLLCGHHLPDQRLVLLQGFTEIKFNPILLCRWFFNFFYWPIVQVVNEYERAVIFRLGDNKRRTYFQPNSLF